MGRVRLRWGWTDACGPRGSLASRLNYLSFRIPSSGRLPPIPSTTATGPVLRLCFSSRFAHGIVRARTVLPLALPARRPLIRSVLSRVAARPRAGATRVSGPVAVLLPDLGPNRSLSDDCSKGFATVLMRVLE